MKHNGYQIVSEAVSKKIPLTSVERDQVKKKFGKPECSFAKDLHGYFCHTHRARCKSYKSIEDIPKDRVKFIESTG